MQASPRPAAPGKCKHRRLTPGNDPDYRYCLDCFNSVFVGTVMPDPRDDKPVILCPSCGKEPLGRGKVCRPCAARENGKKMPSGQKAHSKPITLGPRNRGYVSNPKGSGR